MYCKAEIDDVGGSLASLCQELDPPPGRDEKIIIVMQKGGTWVQWWGKAKVMTVIKFCSEAGEMKFISTL